MHHRLSRLAVIALMAVVIATPAAEAQRRRAVRKAPATGTIHIPELRGTVLDEVTGAPVVQAHVSAGGDSDNTDAAGKFRLRDVEAGAGNLVIEVSRTGYATKTVTLTEPPQGEVTIRLQPGPTVRVRTTAGATFDLDLDSILFGYPVPFAGYTSAEFDEFCKPDGSIVQVHRTEFKRITGPAVLVNQSACCSVRETLRINAELKTGEITNLFFTDACEGYPNIDIIGREHVNGKFQYIRFTNIAEVIFP